MMYVRENRSILSQLRSLRFRMLQYGPLKKHSVSRKLDSVMLRYECIFIWYAVWIILWAARYPCGREQSLIIWLKLHCTNRQRKTYGNIVHNSWHVPWALVLHDVLLTKAKKDKCRYCTAYSYNWALFDIIDAMIGCLVNPVTKIMLNLMYKSIQLIYVLRINRPNVWLLMHLLDVQYQSPVLISLGRN